MLFCKFTVLLLLAACWPITGCGGTVDNIPARDCLDGDGDGDGYGNGPECLGADCDDWNEVYAGTCPTPGQEKWRVRLGDAIQGYRTGSVAQDAAGQLYFTAETIKLAALGSDGKLLWSKGARGPMLATPAVMETTILTAYGEPWAQE